jgi:Zn-dependent metalloprotease
VASPSSVGRAVVRSARELAAPITAGPHATVANGRFDSLTFVRGHLDHLGLAPDHADFKVLESHRGADGLNHVRLQQLHDGVPVWSAQLIVHSTEAGLHGMSGSVVGLQGLPVTPSLPVELAVNAAKADYAAKALTKDALQYQRETQELVILPMEGGAARLTWHVTFFTELQAGIKPMLMNYFVDAFSGQIVHSFNAIDTATVEAGGPGGNAKVSRTWSSYLDVNQSGSTYTMNTTPDALHPVAFETLNLNHGTSGGSDYTSSSLTFGDAAGNDAHGFAEVTIHMLKDWFGYNSINNSGFKLLSRVHYSSGYDNAFWDGAEMTYGDGDNRMFYEMSGALDVVAHEIDHGFTAFHSNLTYGGESGGMNESFSDIAGTTAKFYYQSNINRDATATFDLGGDIVVPGSSLGSALRYMCNPTQDGHSIDNYANYNSSLDVHYTSGIMNKAFCRAAKRMSSGDPNGAATADGVRKAATAWYEANASYWHASATFTDGCQGVMDAAKAMNYDLDALGALWQSWRDVGVTCTMPVPPPPVTCGVIAAGQGLGPGNKNATETLSSCDGRFNLSMQDDGNLVLSETGIAPLFATGTNPSGYTLWMQRDGNLVVYSRSGTAVWASNTWGHIGAWAVLQNDGNLVVRDQNNVYWASNTALPAIPAHCGAIRAGEGLGPSQVVSSCSGQFVLTLQTDGNVVLRDNGQPIWATNTVGTGAILVMQSDGNLVLRSRSGGVAWATNTANHPGAWLAVQDDGNLVIRDDQGDTFWASNTNILPLRFFDASSGDLAATGWPIQDTNVDSWDQAARAAHVYCARKGYVGGLMNGYEGNGLFGVICFGPGAQWSDASDADIDSTGWSFRDNSTPWDNQARAAQVLCNRKGFVGGFFNGYIGPAVHGLICYPGTFIDAHDADLDATGWGYRGNSTGWGQAARAATTFCQQRGYLSGEMNGQINGDLHGVACSQ